MCANNLPSPSRGEESSARRLAGYLAETPCAARAERTWLTMITMMMAIENHSP
jgi:hypothetical protein